MGYSRIIVMLYKPNAVVSERTGAGFGDINAQCVSTIESIASSNGRSSDGSRSLELYTGNRILDQFEPWYFAYISPAGAQCPWRSVDSVLESRAPGLLLLKPREGRPVGGPSRRACGSFRTTGRRSA